MSSTALMIVIVAIVVLIAIAGVVLIQRSRLRRLPDVAKARYAESWKAIETRFIEDPAAAVHEADDLAVSILRDRGAKMEDERRVPSELRLAREAARTTEESSGTEGMRSAMLHYQRIVDDAVGEAVRKAAETGRQEVA